MTAALDLASQRAVVYQRGPDGFQPADSREGVASGQHRAAGRARQGIRSIVHAAERVKQLEEEDEGRNHEPFGGAATVQADHERDEITWTGFRPADEFAQGVRSV